MMMPGLKTLANWSLSAMMAWKTKSAESKIPETLYNGIYTSSRSHLLNNYRTQFPPVVNSLGQMSSLLFWTNLFCRVSESHLRTLNSCWNSSVDQTHPDGDEWGGVEGCEQHGVTKHQDKADTECDLWGGGGGGGGDKKEVLLFITILQSRVCAQRQ